ncbi:MAG: shikimate kinase [Candidatus Neomarinimicrobiota bacterium]|jgi:shikimate kinase|nr:shikimate kinase [Candidatus Neomarinimicrobiota bacterium]MDX9779770.1 shikimate kinase [bacterium]
MSEKGKHLFLTGMMGSGKSSCGRALAELRNWNFIDLDTEIEKMQGKKISDIFREEGEAAFRKYESACARSLKLKKKTVVACGGGFPLRSENRAWMKRLGTVIWLQADPETIAGRVRTGNRPLLQNPQDIRNIRRILDERMAVYETADLRIDTRANGIAEVVQAILRELHE